MRNSFSRKQINNALFPNPLGFSQHSTRIMFKDFLIGGLLFVLTIYFNNKTPALENASNEKYSSDEVLRKVAQQNSNRGRTIYVQVVDEKGNDLPENIVEQKLYEARRNAEPRDNIVTVRHQINTE